MKTVDIEVIGEGVIAIEVDVSSSITTSDKTLIEYVYNNGEFNPKFTVLSETGVTRELTYLQAKDGILVFDGTDVQIGSKITIESEQQVVGGASNYNILTKFNGVDKDLTNCIYPNYGYGRIGCITYMTIINNGGNFGVFNGSGCTVRINKIWIEEVCYEYRN